VGVIKIEVIGDNAEKSGKNKNLFQFKPFQLQ
jgi:hypothetical protein